MSNKFEMPDDCAAVDYTIFNIEGVGYLRFTFSKGGKPVAFPVFRNGRFAQLPLYRIDDITVREVREITAEFMNTAFELPDETDIIRRLAGL
jgi:hypothetical protein